MINKATAVNERDQLLSEVAELRASVQRWKQAVEGLTPLGSEFVDDPERCAAHLRRRMDYPQQIIEARAETAALRQALAQAALPYEALLMDAESRKWIAPEVWRAIEAAVTTARAALGEER